MENREKLVSEKVRSGEYYSDALNWYNSKFVRPKTDFVHISILAGLCVFLFFVSLVTFSSIFPITSSEPFIVSESLDLDESISISEIGIDDKNPTTGVLSFLLKEYVKSREEYIEDSSSRNFLFVSGLSSEKIFDEVLEERDPNNPNNPALLYGKQATIEIDVQKAVLPIFPKSGMQLDFEKEYKAKVNYRSSLIFVSGDIESKKMQADITFKYKEILVDQENHEIKQLPELVVTGYKTKQL